ncbi:MAG: hypothetical protein WB765_21980, partial [Acidimicrobiales bacterium]
MPSPERLLLALVTLAATLVALVTTLVTLTAAAALVTFTALTAVLVTMSGYHTRKNGSVLDLDGLELVRIQSEQLEDGRCDLGGL